MSESLLDKIQLEPRQAFRSKSGAVLRGIRSDESIYISLNEVYFSYFGSLESDEKKHLMMELRILCLKGSVDFTFKDESNKTRVISLNSNSPELMIVPPGIWFKYKGLEDENIIVNFSNILHNENEIVRKI
ncbi:FdtA/QdtA family cupin domain-containing protein [Bacteroidia bacterium]|nr:FdtA/QdtA family cupin domain-containing protein [Bacteroidia bacterium]